MRGFGGCRPHDNHSADNAPQLAGGRFTFFCNSDKGINLFLEGNDAHIYLDQVDF